MRGVGYNVTTHTLTTETPGTYSIDRERLNSLLAVLAEELKRLGDVLKSKINRIAALDTTVSLGLS
jgi:hypothetical protein